MPSVLYKCLFMLYKKYIILQHRYTAFDYFEDSFTTSFFLYILYFNKLPTEFYAFFN